MGGYLPWLPGALCSSTTATAVASDDAKQKAGQKVAMAAGQRRFKHSSAEPAGLGVLLPGDSSAGASGCSGLHTVLRRGLSLPARRQVQVQPLDSLCLVLSSAGEPQEALPPHSQPASSGQVSEDGGDAGSDTDSIASDEWAEALWSPGRRRQPLKERKSSERRLSSVAAEERESTERWRLTSN